MKKFPFGWVFYILAFVSFALQSPSDKFAILGTGFFVAAVVRMMRWIGEEDRLGH